MEDWVTIRNLKNKKPEISNREIAKLLGISHNTVKRALSNETGSEYKRKETINLRLNLSRNSSKNNMLLKNFYVAEFCAT